MNINTLYEMIKQEQRELMRPLRDVLADISLEYKQLNRFGSKRTESFDLIDTIKGADAFPLVVAQSANANVGGFISKQIDVSRYLSFTLFVDITYTAGVTTLLVESLAPNGSSWCALTSVPLLNGVNIVSSTATSFVGTHKQLRVRIYSTVGTVAFTNIRSISIDAAYST